MPLKEGTSRDTVSSNISEFHGGSTYAHTKAKFGKKKADAQAVAVALDKKRDSGHKRRMGRTVHVPDEGHIEKRSF